jgi:hypothetical protein
MMPDFRNFGNKNGLQTELGTSNANDIMQALTDAQRKPLTAAQALKRTPSLKSTQDQHHPMQQRIPDWYRVGWTAFSAKPNPGGALPFLATEKRMDDELDTVFGGVWHLAWWQQTGTIFAIGTVSWCVASLGGGPVSFIVLCLFIGKPTDDDDDDDDAYVFVCCVTHLIFSLIGFCSKLLLHVFKTLPTLCAGRYQT